MGAITWDRPALEIALHPEFRDRVVRDNGFSGPNPLRSPGLSRSAPEGVRWRQAERQQCGRAKIKAAGRNVALRQRGLMPTKADGQPPVLIKGPGASIILRITAVMAQRTWAGVTPSGNSRNNEIWARACNAPKR